MTNDDVIRRGGGSPQARWASESCCKDGDCPICNPREENDLVWDEEEEDWTFLPEAKERQF